MRRVWTFVFTKARSNNFALALFVFTIHIADMDKSARRGGAGQIRLDQATLDDMAKLGRPTLGKTATTLYNFKVDVERLRRWQAAADKARTPLSEWLRDAADAKLKKASKR